MPAIFQYSLERFFFTDVHCRQHSTPTSYGKRAGHRAADLSFQSVSRVDCIQLRAKSVVGLRVRCWFRRRHRSRPVGSVGRRSVSTPGDRRTSRDDSAIGGQKTLGTLRVPVSLRIESDESAKSSRCRQRDDWNIGTSARHFLSVNQNTFYRQKFLMFPVTPYGCQCVHGEMAWHKISGIPRQVLLLAVVEKKTLVHTEFNVWHIHTHNAVKGSAQKEFKLTSRSLICLPYETITFSVNTTQLSARPVYAIFLLWFST